MKLDATAIAIPATDDEVPMDPIRTNDSICVELYQHELNGKLRRVPFVT